MSFLSPTRLWLLLAVVALAGVYLAMQLRRRDYAVRFTNMALLDSVAPKRPGWRRHVPAVVFLLASAVLVGAFAQPARDEQIPRERATIVMAIDTSLSMEATDVSPSRIEAAKDAATSFVDLLPEKVNLGLVTFDGAAVVRVTPTTDRQVVRDAIEGLSLHESTAIGEAIFASLAAIETVPPDEEGTEVPARIILMSDGETTSGRPDEDAVVAALEAKVPISTIAFGTDDGFITLPEDPEPIPVPVNREALGSIAEATGGSFFEAASGDQLRSVYKDIGSSVGYTTELREITPWFVAGALVLLFVSGGLSLVWFSRLP